MRRQIQIKQGPSELKEAMEEDGEPSRPASSPFGAEFVSPYIVFPLHPAAPPPSLFEVAVNTGVFFVFFAFTPGPPS